MRVWRRGEPVEEIRPRHGDEQRPAFIDSPVRSVWETGEPILRRLDLAGQDGPDYPVYAELSAAGLTHYVMLPLVFSDGTRHAVSFATDRRGGFAPRDLEGIRGLLDALSLAMEVLAIRRVSTEVLRTYVGFEPSERILSGDIRRGETKRLEAAVFLSDLRGFTSASETAPPEEVVALLNAYLDCVVPAVEGAGGEILKFIGDGVLAVFPGSEATAASACGAALTAAQAALHALAAAGGARPLRAGIALHYGEVAYGNIGSGDRLDFTVVGRDVNLVSRIQGLCSELERPLLVSDVFATRAALPCEPVGSFELKGLRDRHQVFAPGATP
jgi:adenylate cyclase